LLRAMAKRAEMRSGIQGVEQRSTDKAFVRSKKLELAVYKFEELFFQRCFTKPWIVTDGSDGMIDFFLEEKESNVFFGSEVVEDGSFGDTGFSCDRFRRGWVKSFGLEESEGCLDDPVTDRLFALRPLPGFTGLTGFGFSLRSHRHKFVSTLMKYMSALMKCQGPGWLWIKSGVGKGGEESRPDWLVTIMTPITQLVRVERRTSQSNQRADAGTASSAE